MTVQSAPGALNQLATTIHRIFGTCSSGLKCIIRESNSGNDSARIASLGEDSRICIWDLETGKLITRLEAHPGASVWTADWNSNLGVLVSSILL